MMPTPLELLKNQKTVLEEFKLKVKLQEDFQHKRGNKNFKFSRINIANVDKQIEEYKEAIKLLRIYGSSKK